MGRILIIEDEEGIRESLQDILEISGYDVLTSKDGVEGLHAITVYRPHLVLCDVNMPNLNGLEMLREMKRRRKEDGLPIFIFLTARAEDSVTIEGLLLGAVAYITKPFDHIDLLKTVKIEIDKVEMEAKKQQLKNAKSA
jgi:DNA-binding response OmpR family regulator